MKFPIPVIPPFRNFYWKKGSIILGIVDIVASLIAFAAYISLHFLNPIQFSEAMLTFHIGMNLLELAFLIYFCAAAGCILIALTNSHKKCLIWMLICIEIIGVLIHSTGIVMVSFTSIGLDEWVRHKSTHLLSIINLGLTLVIGIPFKFYWCYLAVYLYARGSVVHFDDAEVEGLEEEHVRLQSLSIERKKSGEAVATTGGVKERRATKGTNLGVPMNKT